VLDVIDAGSSLQFGRNGWGAAAHGRALPTPAGDGAAVGLASKGVQPWQTTRRKRTGRTGRGST
jgi:hypothetical protein